MRALEVFSIIIVFGLLFWVANQEVETKKIFDAHNESFIERVSPKYDENGLQKSWIERSYEVVLFGPTKLFPKYPWLGMILVFGGLFIIIKKWELIWSKIKRDYLFGK